MSMSQQTSPLGASPITMDRTTEDEISQADHARLRGYLASSIIADGVISLLGDDVQTSQSVDLAGASKQHPEGDIMVETEGCESSRTSGPLQNHCRAA